MGWGGWEGELRKEVEGQLIQDNVVDRSGGVGWWGGGSWGCGGGGKGGGVQVACLDLCLKSDLLTSRRALD